MVKNNLLKNSNHLLLATWNIANIELQDRKNNDYRLISEMISHGLNITALFATFLQGCNFPSCKAGNFEKLAFLYDSTNQKLTLWRNCAVPPIKSIVSSLIY